MEVDPLVSPVAGAAVLILIAFGAWAIDRWQQRRRRSNSK